MTSDSLFWTLNIEGSRTVLFDTVTNTQAQAGMVLAEHEFEHMSNIISLQTQNSDLVSSGLGGS